MIPAIFLAFLAFAQASAAIGRPLPMVGSMDLSFQVWRPALQRLQQKLLAAPDAATASLATKTGRGVLESQPMATEALRLMALAEPDTPRAEAQMMLAARLTRRDTAVQSWLIEAAVQRNDLTAALGRYDTLLRTTPSLRPLLLGKLAGIVPDPEFQRAMLGYLKAGSPWVPQFLHVAGARPDALAPLTQLLVSAPTLPGSPAYLGAYRKLVLNLVREKDFTSLARLYPRLPGRLGPNDLTDPALVGSPNDRGYAPFKWAMAQEPDRSVDLAGSDGGQAAMSARAAPLTRGVALSRLFLLPHGDRALSWFVRDITTGAAGAAHWRAECLDTGAISESINLLGQGGAGQMRLPPNCRAVQLQLILEGGTRGDGVSLQLSRLKWLTTGTDKP